MDDLVSGDLRIAVRDVAPGAALELHWTGKSNDRHPARAVVPFIEAVFARATAEARAVELHFERIEHFNSSTVAALIQLIQAARNAKLSLAIVYDAGLRWQRMSFDALKALTAKDEMIELRASPASQ
jgi:hypothetical protein